MGKVPADGLILLAREDEMVRRYSEEEVCSSRMLQLT